MPIGLGSGLWAYVAPIDATNIQTNPSFEFGNAGVVAIQSATLGTTSQFQRYGAQSLKVTPGANGTSGAILGTWVSGIGTTYSVSAWAFVEAGVPMRIAIGDGNGLNLTNGSVTFTGGGTWQWYNTGIIEVSNINRALVIQKTSGNSQLPFYVDGVMINPWTDSQDRVLTYFDGDTGGGTWTGAQHASQSTRSGQYRGGGSIIALADLGFSVDQMLGVGVSPIENSAQSYAVTDGAQFQRQRAATRKFTLTAKPIVGTSLADFHATRRTIWDAFKPDAVTPQQPTRLLYYGAQGTQYIDAFYDKGLELGNMDGPIAENAAISFVSYDPYWYAPTQQGTTLSPQTAIGSANYIVKRSAQGVWGTLGVAGTTVRGQVTAGPQIHALAIGTDNKIIIGGDFGTVGGTTRQCLALYDPFLDTFGTFPSGTINGPVKGIAATPGGTIYFGGQFSNINGTAGANNLAFWAGNFGSFPSAGVNNNVNAVLYSPTGTLYFGGDFSAFGGTLQPFVGLVVGNAFGSLTGGSIGGGVRALAIGADSALYVGGAQLTAGGTQSIGISRWNGAFGTLTGGTLAYNLASVDVYSIAVGPNGQLVIGGVFGTIANAANNSITSFNGISFTPLAQGFGPRTVTPIVKSIVIDSNGVIIAGGTAMANANGIPLPDNIAQNPGGAWVPLGIDLPGQGVVNAMLQSQGVLYVAGSFAGTAIAASVGTLVNAGRANVYPSLRFRNTGVGTVRMTYLINNTTGAAIYFNSNMSLIAQEQVTLTLQPGTRSFQSNFRGNIFGQIMPTSNLASWNLQPGTNYVSLFADSGSVDAAFFWQPRSLLIDGGTIL